MSDFICTRCGGSTVQLLTLMGAHRNLQYCVAELKRQVAELTPRATFGDQCYQDRCENAFVEQSVVKRLERQVAWLKDERNRPVPTDWEGQAEC